MTIFLVKDMITFLNIFPSKNGTSSNLIPVAIIIRFLNPYHNNLKSTFGAYAQV